MLKLIVCVDVKNGIAKQNQIPWKIKSELQHFKNVTTNHVVVMGHKTFISIGKLLPNRDNIIFSRNKNLIIDGAKVTDNIVEIIQMAKTKDVFIIGGQQIYQLFKDDYDELIISRLSTDYECDLQLDLNLTFYSLFKEIFEAEFTVEYYRRIKAKILSGRTTALTLQTKLTSLMNNLIEQYNVVPHLVIIQLGNEYASQVYVRNKIRLGSEIGIKVSHVHLQKSTETELLDLIKKYNEDSTVHGILIQLPLPPKFNQELIAQSIDPNKDVDCFHPYNIGKMWINTNDDNANILPCTPFGIIQLLKLNKIDIESKQVVILGRSNIVGKPLACLFLQANATVQICHSHTKNLKRICQQADILISAVGKANFVTKEFIKIGCVVIDVGINHNSANKACGDVDFASVKDLVSAISPVPGGVGPMTLISLFYNLLKLYQKQHTL